MRINGTVLDLTQNKTLELAPGTYQAEFWAPKFEVEKLSITVEAGKPTVVRKAMKNVAPAFETYRKERSRIATMKLKRSLADGVLVGVPILTAYGSLRATRNGLTNEDSQIAEAERDIIRAREQYESSISVREINAARELYNANIESYERLQRNRNTTIVVGASVAAIGTGLAVIYFTKWRKKIAKPVYTEENPFVLQRRPTLEPNFTFTNRGNRVGLVFTF